MRAVRATLAWAGVALAVLVPVLAAATSPLLAWRQPVYVVAGLAGIAGLCLMLFQPLLAGGYLPGLRTPRGRRVHRLTGALLVLAVAVHVGGLWLTSPPDVVDALAFMSPAPFAAWGVVAMWAVFVSAGLAVLRRRLRLRPRVWRIAHTALACVIVAGSVVHALLIEGTMETLSKAALCALVLAATVAVIADLRVWTRRRPQR